MRSFVDIQQELGLKKFLASRLGTLYFVPYATGAPRVMVRRFDGELDPEQIPAYVDLVRAAQAWLEDRPPLARLVRVEQPTEVGRDFVARPNHSYYTSTAAYTRDDAPEPPRELTELRRLLVEAFADQPADTHEEIVRRVLARSLVEPTDKTYFSGREGFVVVEPKLAREDLEAWSAESGTIT